MMQFLSRFFSLFWLLLLVQSMYYPMVLAEPFESSIPISTPTITAMPPADPFLYFADPEPVPPTVTPTSGSTPTDAQGSPFVCRFSELSPQENANILDFVKKGEKLDEFQGTPQSQSDLNESLPQDTALVPDSKGEIALKQSFPNKLFKPDQAGFLLNRSGTGAFAAGVVMQDTLRVGRCVDLQRQTSPAPPTLPEGSAPAVTTASGKAFDAITDSSKRTLKGETCWVETPGLNYPNYDQEFLGSPGLAKVENAIFNKDVLAWRSDPVYEKSLGTDALTLMEAAAVTQQGNIDSLDQADPEGNTGITAQTVQRVPGIIPNRWQTEDFTAKLQTPCANSSCAIDVYSLFSKYFNSAASVGMVITNFGPTLFHEAGRLFGRAGKTAVYPFEESFGTLKKRISEAFLGKNLAQNASRRARISDYYRKYPEIKSEFINSLTKGPGDNPAIFGVGGGEGKVFEFLKADGKVAKMLDTPQKQRDFTAFLKDFQSVVASSNLQVKSIQAEYAAGTLSKIEYQKKVAKAIFDLDEPDAPGIDFLAYYLKQPEFGLSDAYYFNKTTGAYQPISSTNFGFSMKKVFIDPTKNDFSDLGKAGIQLTDDGLNIKLFKINPGNNAIPATQPALESFIKNEPGKYFIQINGKWTPLTEDTLKSLPDPGSSGFYSVVRDPKVFTQFTDATGQPVDMTMETFGDRFTERDFITSRLNNVQIVTETMVNVAKNQNLISRPYLSLLDQQFASEKKLTESYFGIVNGKLSPTGPIQWTALPFVYAWAKRGFGNEAISLYQLPDSYNELQIDNGSDPIYNDAYIDFFANAQSDQGDAFLALLNELPWKQILDKTAENWAPMRDGVKYLSGEPSRKKVEDVATIIYSPKTCSSCGANLQQFNGAGQPATISFKSGEKLTSFLFENPTSEDAKKVGSFLIAFSHHSNLKDSKGEGESIDVSRAISQDKGGKPTTCGAVAKDLFFGIASFTPQQAGLLLTAGETIGYVAFGGTLGLIGSFTQQLVFAPKLQNCVDAEGGYYAHYFVANEEASPESKTAKELGSEKAGKLVDSAQKSFADSLTGLVSNKDDTPSGEETAPESEGGQGVVRNAMNELTKNTDQLVAKVQQDSILQATVQSIGTSNGHVNGNRLFWLWFSGENDLDVTKYDTTTQTNLTTKDGSLVNINNQTGQITFFDKNTGKTTVLVNQGDHTRLTSHNLTVPAEEIPARLNGVGLPGTATPMIDVLASGRSMVVDERIADCFREASLKQTGVPLNELDSRGSDLTPAFGRVTEVFTDQGTASPQETKIVMEGTNLSFTADASSSKIEILGNRETRIYGADTNAVPVGKLESIHFEHGIVVYKPQSNELLIWLKHHGQAILSEKDVANLRGKLTNTINPNTKCSEPAIDLSALANPNSPESARKVDNFNKGMALNGPFQVFDTDKKTFILYSDANCTPHFKIIDKETGEVYDQAIKNITQTDKGVQIQTADGLTHDIGFGTQNGKPTLTYNGEEQLLRSAQGKNGSFYFDPDKGLYYAENGQFLPLNDSFKSQGLSVKGNPDGSVTGNPGINIFNQGTQGGGGNAGLFNLPTIPPQGGIIALVLIVALLSGFLVLNERSNHRSLSVRKKKK